MSINKATSTSLPRQDIAGSLMATKMLWAPIATLIFPVFATPSKVGNLGKIPIKALLARAQVARAANGGYNRTGWKFEDDTYSCAEFGQEEKADDSERALYGNQFDYDMVLANRGRMILVREQEQRVADVVLSTTNFPLSGNTGATVSNAWTSAANGTPITDCIAAKAGVRARYGFDPDTIVIPRARWDYLWQNNEVRDNMKYTVVIKQPDVNDENARNVLASTLGFRKLFIGDMPYDSANEGQTASISNVWTATKAFVCKTADGNDISEPCVGRTMAWEQDGGVLTVEQYRDESVRADIMRVRQHVQEKLLLDAGYLLSGI